MTSRHIDVMPTPFTSHTTRGDLHHSHALAYTYPSRISAAAPCPADHRPYEERNRTPCMEKWGRHTDGSYRWR